MLGTGALGHTALGAVPTQGPATGSAPPFTHPGRSAALAAIVAAWQPPDPSPHIGGPQPLHPRRLNPALIAVEEDPPPFTRQGPTCRQQAVAVWPSLPAEWPYAFIGGRAPYAPLKMSAGIPGQSIDNPPFTHPSRTVAAIALAAARAQPPILVDPTHYRFLGGRAPLQGRQLAAGIPGQSIDNPPFTHPARTPAQRALVTTWQPPTWPYVFAGGRAPYTALTMSPGIPGLSADPPPFARRRNAATERLTLTAWQPEPWPYAFIGGRAPYTPLKMSAGIPGLSVDNPPFARRRLIETMAQLTVSWQPPDPQPWIPRHQVKFFRGFSMLIIIG